MKYIILSILLFVFSIPSQSKLQQLFSIFRHGARYSLNSLYDGGKYQPFWGQLTGVGMRQHQKIGSILRKQYIQDQQFLSSNYTKEQMEIYSTQINRTMQSVLSQLYGLYPSETGPTLMLVDRKYYLPPYTNKTDYPQHNFALPHGYQNIIIDFNQHFLQDNCDNQLQWYQKNIQAQIDQYDQMLTTYKPFLRKLTETFNLTDNITFATVASLGSNIQNSIHLGNPLPKNFTDDDLNNIRHLTSWYHQLIVVNDLAKAQNIFKFEKIFSNFESKIKNPGSKLKLTLLSGHDTDLWPLYDNLNISTSTCIEQIYRKGSTSALNCQLGAFFASSIIFQLHSQDNDYYVKIRVDGKYANLCEAQQTKCKYNEWKQRIMKNIGTAQLAKKICGTLSSPFQVLQEQQESDKSQIWLNQLGKIIKDL